MVLVWRCEVVKKDRRFDVDGYGGRYSYLL